MCQNASSGSATCVAVRLSIIGISRQDERSRPAEKEGGGRDGGVCASKCIERLCSYMIANDWNIMPGQSLVVLANGGLSDYVIKTPELIVVSLL